MASGTSTTTSVLDSRSGRTRARAMLTVDWLVINALAPVDPLAQVLRGSPRTDVYAAYEKIRIRGDLASSRLGLRSVTSRRQSEAILRDLRFGVQPATADSTPKPDRPGPGAAQRLLPGARPARGTPGCAG